MKVISLFSGIGAPEKALKNLGVPLELIAFSEIDKYAVKSYCAIHGVDESLNLGDITKVDATQLPKDIDLITYGFPCQDISLAGKQKGLFNEDGSQTRSGLFFEALRVIEATQPKVAIAENVKNLVGKKFKPQFELVLQSLESAGYNNYWKVLNAKDYGIPQNRERAFIVSIRKDIDNGSFKFPEGFPLEKRLKDVLEDEVDEKYYLSDKMLKYAFNIEKEAKGIGFSDGVNRSYINSDIAQTIGCRSAAYQRSGTTNYVSDDKEKVQVADWKRMNRVYSPEGIASTQTVKSGGGRETKVLLPVNPTADGLCKTIKSQYHKTGPANLKEGSHFGATGATDGTRIRKLTPKECFRLMGFDDEDFEKAEAVNSNTQLYKQAGNSIVVDVLEHLIKGVLDMKLWTDNPVLDAERYYEDTEPKKIGVCEHCSDPIYENEDYYDIHGDMIHEDCLREWADEQYKVS